LPVFTAGQYTEDNMSINPSKLVAGSIVAERIFNAEQTVTFLVACNPEKKKENIFAIQESVNRDLSVR
jgi:hypothetical protein